MSYMICQKVETFSLQIMAREAISLVWGGLTPKYSGGRKYASPTKVMSYVLAILTTFQIEFWNKWYIIGKP